MIEYEEEWLFSLLWKHEGSVAMRASLYAVPSAILAVLLIYVDEWFPGKRQDMGMTEVTSSQCWSAATVTAVFLLGFRTRQALARFWEGTGLLHQMRGEWFDTVSNCVTFSLTSKATNPEKVLDFRHTIVRLMSLAHGSALEEIAGDQVELDTIDILGLDGATLRHVKECNEKYGFNKVEVILHLVQSLITKANEDGVIKVPPPILSRVYQTISRGFVNLLNAKKITDTRFPFPYAQLTAHMLVVLTFLTPMMLSIHMHSKVLAATFTFVMIFGIYSLNFIAAQLENPFGLDPNDLPLAVFQGEMNNCLLMLLHDNTDIIAHIGPDCMTDFKQLYKEICPGLGIGEAFTSQPAKSENPARDGFRRKSRRETRLCDVTDEWGEEWKPIDSINEDNHEGPSGFGSASFAIGDKSSDSLKEQKASPRSEEVAESAPILVASPGIDEHGNPTSEVHLMLLPTIPSQELPPDVPQSKAMSAGGKKFELGMTSNHETPQTPQPPRTVQTPRFMQPRDTWDVDVTPADLHPPDVQTLLKSSMDDFNRSMRRWTELIESQMFELDRNCNALRNCSDSINARCTTGWETAMPTL